MEGRVKTFITTRDGKKVPKTVGRAWRKDDGAISVEIWALGRSYLVEWGDGQREQPPQPPKPGGYGSHRGDDPFKSDGGRPDAFEDDIPFTAEWRG